MSKELSQLSSDVISSIVLNGDLSGLNKAQQVDYVSYRCQKAGLDVAGNPFLLMKNKDGKVVIYATKEAAAQLNQIRALSPTVAKEEFLMENSIYKVTYRVTEGGRSTEDCGAVGLVKIKKGVQGQPDEVRKMAPEEVADAIMKAHTKAKRRAILTHCGIGTPDGEDLPLVIPDMGNHREEIKQADAKVKDAPAPEVQKPADPDVIGWRGTLKTVETLELPGGKSAWTVMGSDGAEFKTADATFADFARSIITEKREARIQHKKNAKGSNVIQSLEPVGEVA